MRLVLLLIPLADYVAAALVKTGQITVVAGAPLWQYVLVSRYFCVPSHRIHVQSDSEADEEEERRARERARSRNRNRNRSRARGAAAATNGAAAEARTRSEARRGRPARDSESEFSVRSSTSMHGHC